MTLPWIFKILTACFTPRAGVVLRSQKHTTLIYTAYVFCSGCTTMWVASRQNRQRGFCVLWLTGFHACWCYWKQFAMLKPTCNLMPTNSMLRVCFFNEYMWQHVCFPFLGQRHESSTELGRKWTWPTPWPAVAFSSCEWIINSRTRTSRTFLCTILSPHDLWIRNALRMVMSVRWKTRFLVYFQAPRAIP